MQAINKLLMTVHIKHTTTRYKTTINPLKVLIVHIDWRTAPQTLPLKFSDLPLPTPLLAVMYNNVPTVKCLHASLPPQICSEVKVQRTPPIMQCQHHISGAC